MKKDELKKSDKTVDKNQKSHTIPQKEEDGASEYMDDENDFGGLPDGRDFRKNLGCGG